jgi:hypothetical protein
VLARDVLLEIDHSISGLSEDEIQAPEAQRLLSRMACLKSELDEIHGTASRVEQVLRDIEGTENWTPISEDKVVPALECIHSVHHPFVLSLLLWSEKRDANLLPERGGRQHRQYQGCS